MTHTTVNLPPAVLAPLDRALTAADFSSGGRTTLPALAQGPLARKLVTENYREQSRAMLASTALDNTAALSSMAAHLSAVAPYGHYCYYAIVQAYTIGAVNAIARC